MITDPAEIEAAIESTRDLIESDGLDISLVRQTWQETASGGVTRVDATPQAPVRRYFGSVTTEPIRRTREEGEFLLIRHVIVGMPDDDIQEKDTFTIGNRKFEVVDVDPNLAWQRRGWVVERA